MQYSEPARHVAGVARWFIGGAFLVITLALMLAVFTKIDKGIVQVAIVSAATICGVLGFPIAKALGAKIAG